MKKRCVTREDYLPGVDDWNNPLSPIFSALSTVYGRAVAVFVAAVMTVSSGNALGRAYCLFAQLSLSSGIVYLGLACALALGAGLILLASLGPAHESGSLGLAFVLLGLTALITTALGVIAVFRTEQNMADAAAGSGVLLTSFGAVLATTLTLRIRAIRRVLREDRAVQLGLNVRCHACEQDLSAAIKRAEKTCPHCGVQIHPVAIRAAHRRWKQHGR